MHPYYGGRMTNDRLLAVKNATCEAIDHLHKSLESCPDPEEETSDPRGIKMMNISLYLSSRLADYDVVVTTYNLVSKEIPVQKEDADDPSKDPDHMVNTALSWARVILDEAHNIKNPKVQTSMAVCQLRARARWAVTGTPIQNNLLDMYSLLKFLRCSPFDEYKLWKAQVDNGSTRGRERLNILTKTLLLRRTKDQLDSMGKPLTLDSSELQGDGIVLSLEEQLNALSLSSTPSPSGGDPKDTVALNGTRFPSQLFEETSKGTKCDCVTVDQHAQHHSTSSAADGLDLRSHRRHREPQTAHGRGGRL
ncbi:hypothetical protein XENOCAPTIV_025886 [Xenoophorus captivus]|uniref:Helicase ATP-binding domain-containing protein n=1 Tax=Xenoophorus captivus TaxID=1517983 RepID=A0ABV0QN08_9TELE